MNGRCTLLFQVECQCKSDCCRVEVNLATLTWGYYQIVNIYFIDPFSFLSLKSNFFLRALFLSLGCMCPLRGTPLFVSAGWSAFTLNITPALCPVFIPATGHSPQITLAVAPSVVRLWTPLSFCAVLLPITKRMQTRTQNDLFGNVHNYAR